MKKIIASFLMLTFLCGCTASSNPQPVQNTEIQKESSVSIEYVKSVWITYYELEKLTADNENEFKINIESAFKKVKDMGFNTVTVQVRPCADAFYDSDYFPVSKYCFARQESELIYDPLKIMCETAEKLSLSIEAWINPYRVSQDGKIDSLSNNNIAKKWYEDKSTSNLVYVTENGIYFNPSAEEVIDLIVNGVKEIVKNYNVSAIHFDDYFYPTTKKDIDSVQYSEYKKNGGKLSLGDFRRSRISSMVKSVYKAIKSINKNVKFGISPASNINNDYEKLYADVTEWMTEKGYVDYICPQIYFGFKNVYQPFMFTVKKWAELSSCDLYIGLPLYKSGKADKYAAKEDKTAINEFKSNSNIISRQIKYITQIDKIKGFYIFSYEYLFDEGANKEVENMLKVMQSNNRP